MQKRVATPTHSHLPSPLTTHPKYTPTHPHTIPATNKECPPTLTHPKYNFIRPQSTPPTHKKCPTTPQPPKIYLHPPPSTATHP